MTAVAVCCLAGCGKKGVQGVQNEPRQIDAKDEPGAYRAQIRDNVMRRVGMHGEPVSDRSLLIGFWDVTVDMSMGHLPPEPFGAYNLKFDGSCDIETAIGDQMLKSTAWWRLNADGTFSLFVSCSPDPSVPALENGAIDEQRYFLMRMPDGRQALWNGDGSVLLLLSPKEGAPRRRESRAVSTAESPPPPPTVPNVGD